MDGRDQVSPSVTGSATHRNGASSVHNPATSTADLPPSYNEAVSNPTFQTDQPSEAPSAPLLEAHATNALPAAASHFYAQNFGRFSAWDDRATKILMVNRLDMNERFERARNPLERRLLWNTILSHLLASGYSFAMIDLIQSWEFIFYIYKIIINNLAAGINLDTSWKYLEPMDKVFKYSTKACRPKSKTLSSVPNLYGEILPHASALSPSDSQVRVLPSSTRSTSEGISESSVHDPASSGSDSPPSYNEVVNKPTFQESQPSESPSAPPLEAHATNHGRFNSWDDKATEMLIKNRLEMNEKFKRARNPLKRDELWNIILSQLLASGYSFAMIDLIQFWELQFYTYRSIINNLAAGINSDNSWKYLEPMDKVFKYSTEAPRPNSAVTLLPVSDLYQEIAPDAPLLLRRDREINDVVTTQPRSQTHSRTPITPSTRCNNHAFDEDDCRTCGSECNTCCYEIITGHPADSRNNGGYCCFINCAKCDDCWYTCCTGYPATRRNTDRAETPAIRRNRADGYSSVSRGYISRNDDYDTGDFSDVYTSEYTGEYSDNYCTSGDIGDDNHCHTRGRSNEVNSSLDDGCCDTSGPTNEINTSREDSCCHTSNRTSEVSNSRDDGCCDTSGGGGDYGGCDTGGGVDDYGGCDTGGGNDDNRGCDTGGGCDD